jgi:hypothetical protein
MRMDAAADHVINRPNGKASFINRFLCLCHVPCHISMFLFFPDSLIPKLLRNYFQLTSQSEIALMLLP